MTLNITILTPKIIYQSADYALFDERAGQPVLMPSTKAVVLSNFDWTGFITYTGIGRVGNKHTSEYVQEWVRDLDRPSFEEVVELIRNRASLWVQAVKPAARQTFVIAAFVDGRPTAAVVSNFQKWHGSDSSTIDKNFAVSTIVAQRRTEVIVTGIRDAVPRPGRRALQRVAEEHFHDGSCVRRALAEANRDGAQRYPGRISEDCFVYSQDSGGQGHYEAMGATRTENPMAVGDLDANRLVRNLLDKEFGPGRWSLKGMTSISGQDQSTLPAPCEVKVAPDRLPTGYRIVELATPDGRRASPRSINTNGIIVGEGSVRWRGSSYPCFWPKQTHVEFLAHGGGFGGAAHDINDAGVIVGSSEWPDRASHACTWNLAGRASDIGEAIARHSQAKALNRSGTIAGWVSIHPTEGGQAHFRPAYWPTSGSPIILDDLAGGWGEAVDINSMGVILVRVHKGKDIALSHEAGAWLWDGGQVTEIGKPSSEFGSFYPHRVTDEGCVVGLTIRKDGQRCGAVRSVNGTWSPLFTPVEGRELTAVNRQLLIAGYDLLDYYRVPWVKQEGREMTYLPHYKYHHHHITMVSEQGWAIGTASADNCCHPLLWIPT